MIFQINILNKIIKVLKKTFFNLLNRDIVTGIKIFQIKETIAKIGTDYGGWFIPETYLNQNSICYCVGAGEDISFDIGLIKKFDCNVFTFDPTPKAIKHIDELEEKLKNDQKMPINNSSHEFYDLQYAQLNKLHFEPIGLWNCDTVMNFYAPKNSNHVSHSIKNLQKSSDFFEAECKSIKTIMAENSHQTIDLLKLDVEGAEYEIIEFIVQHNIPIRILCVEYDEFYNQKDRHYLSRIKSSIDSLMSVGYKMLHSDGSCNYTFMKIEN